MTVSWLSSRLVRDELPPFGKFADLVEPIRPTFVDAFAMVVGDQSHRAVRELETSAFPFSCQLVLDEVGARIRHEHRPRDFQQSGRLDHLHVTPEMTSVV